MTLSDSCKSFISGLLCLNVNDRMDCKQALSHEWISKGKASTDHFDAAYLFQIKLFSRANKLQQILIHSVFSEMDKDEKHQIMADIRDIDINGGMEETEIINYILTRECGSGQSKDLQIRSPDIESLLDELETDQAFKIFNPDVHHELEEIDESKDSGNAEDDEDNFRDFPSNGSSKMISVAKFSKIMAASEQSYDVDLLVQRLDPTDSGHILLDNISDFEGTLISKETCRGVMADWAESGLQSKYVYVSDADEAANEQEDADLGN